MRGSVSAIAGVVVAALGIGVAAGVLHARETRLPLEVPGSDDDLRSGQTADRRFLTFDAWPDIYWIWTIQHYGRDVRSDRAEGRFELLEPLLDLTTTLDPYFNVAYRSGPYFGGGSSQGTGRTDQAVAPRKGAREQPWPLAVRP